jgi:hypothetical protein
MQGRVFGGDQPIAGAVIQLYAAGKTGNGSAATALISSTVTTGAGGSFSITNDYNCPNPSNTPVYLTATGGNPGLPGSVNNTAIALVAALGPCNNLTSSTFILINEATTAAAAWALAPFSTSLTNIGASGTNFTGISNAFATADQLASPSTGQSPSSSVPPGTVMESAKLYSLADALASCASSNGSGTPCSSLFTDVTPSGGTAPADTFGAALDVVKNPGHNVAKIFTNHVGSTPPFPGLTAAPNDWTISIAYTAHSDKSRVIAIDAAGNVFTGSTGIEAFTHTGFPFAGTPYTNSYLGTNDGYGLVVDSGNNLWLGSSIGTDVTVNNGKGGVFEYNESGSLLSPATGDFGGGITKPYGQAVDLTGNIWVANQSASSVTVLKGASGSAFSSTPINTGSGSVPVAMAIDSNNFGWIANTGFFSGTSIPYVLSIPAPTTAAPSPTATIISGTLTTNGVAVDGNSYVWFTAEQGDTLTQLADVGGNAIATANTGGIGSGGGLVDPIGIAIDGANVVWVANYNTGCCIAGAVSWLSEFSASSAGGGTTNVGGAPLSPSTGFGRDAGASLFYALAIDSSGSIWVTSQSSPTVLTFVGLATPVKTPLIGPPQAP